MRQSTIGSLVTSAFILLGAGTAAWAGVPNGVPQKLTPHAAKRPAPASLLAPVHEHAQAAQGLARSYAGTPIDVAEYHYDRGRTGWNPTETDLTPATVRSSSFGLLATLPVDGNVFAQPLLVSNYTLPDGTTHDILVIATGQNTIYAFDAHSYAQLWKVSLGPQQSTGDVGCDDVLDGYGISATPVIVRSGSSATLYVVDAIEPSRYEFHTRLHALDLGTGLDTRPPVEINPSAKLPDKSTLRFDPQNQWVRAGIAYDGNGSLYLGVASHCDNNAYGISGWLLKYGTDLVSKGALPTIKRPHGYELATIWMTGFAPAIDPLGNVFVVTGNGDFTRGAMDWGQSVLKITPKLAVASWFTPGDYSALNDGDVDFGSGGVMLLPHVAGQKGPDTAVAIGKAGVLYMLKQRSLGGNTPGDVYALQKTNVGGGVWGGPAYYNGPSGPIVFEQGDGGLLNAFSVSPDKPAFVRTATGTSGAGYGGSLPIVSSNGAAPGTGVVWVVRRSDPIEIEAYNAETLGAPIYKANIGRWSGPSHGNSFLTAMQANGRVYVAAYKTVKVFGLTN